MSESDKVAERLSEAGLGTDRYVSVENGSKRSLNHDTQTDIPSGNYGVYAKATDGLVLVDIDDYDDLEDKSGLKALTHLPATFEQESANGGTHRFYKAKPSSDGKLIAAVFEEKFGTKNPNPSFGEVRVANQYVVGAGSELNNGKEYNVQADREVATVEAAELVDVLNDDPDLAAEDADTDDSNITEFDLEDSSERLEFAFEHDEKLERLFNGDYSDYDGDRSEAESALAWKLAFWFEGDKNQVRRLMDRANTKKWDEREDDSYRESVLEAVDAQTDHFEQNGGYQSGSKHKVEIPDANDANGGTEGESGSGEQEPDQTARDKWGQAIACYNEDDQDGGRWHAAAALELETSWMYVLESETLFTYDDDRGWFTADGEAYAQRLLEDKLRGHYRINERNEIIEKLKARNQTKREELNAGTIGEPVLCVGNGVVNFETGELEEHSPEFKFTRGIEYDYDEDRADKGAITDFLDSLTTRTEDRDTLLDHLAHGLMPGHPYRAFVITYGPGGNGKTQLGELFRGFVGSDNAAAVELQDLTGEDDFASGALPSAFVNIGDDVSVGEIRNTSILKTVTGGGTLRANEKHEKRYDFTNEAAMFFSANEPPRIAEDKQSIADRLYPIEMPYRFVDDPDPDNPFESQKVPGISEQLLEDDAAMRGLLALAVEHGHELVKSNGQYSMPESPSGRRAMYEAASDPIQRFVLRHLEEGDGGDMILKDDAYSVYTQLCSRDNERPAAEDGFKRKISQQSIIDLESGQTRRLTSGDSAVTCWKYVRFTDGAKELMPDRLLERYFPGADSDESPEDGEVNNDDVASDEQQAFGAEPVRDAAKSLTGYVTVTVEVVTTHRLGDSGAGVKAVVKDASGAMDVVSWEAELGDQLEAYEGDCVVIQNAEVSEYDGSHQLTTVDGLTTISDIQRGVGYTNSENVEPAEEAVGSGKQSGLEESSQTTTTDGGEEYETAHPQIVEELRTNGEMSVPELAGRLGEDPSYIEDTVQSLSENGAIITEDNGGSLTARLD